MHRLTKYRSDRLIAEMASVFIFIRREAIASPSIRFTLWRVSTVFMRSGITPPEVNRSDDILGTLSAADPRRSDSERAMRFFVQ